MHTCQQSRCPRTWKGKAPVFEPLLPVFVRDGGEDGSSVPLNFIQTSVYETVYTVSVQVGQSDQTLDLQVDTGSSDLWIASTSCNTAACKQASGSLYDASHSTPTGQKFHIDYVEGEVDGPIVWDTLTVGGYVIDTQAIAAASVVSDEPLSRSFSGILGLALPQNSVIASLIPPVTGNQPDGAVFASNLFTMTPSAQAPSARFLSLTLARPEANGAGIPSLLGIGRHPPTSIVPDPGKVQYAALTSPSSSGPFYWQAQVSRVSVWVDGVEKIVNVGMSMAMPGSPPTAVVDSGMPIILTSSAIANGIYGALGIGPASDGNYYVPCTTPLNMTITLDARTPLPLHPLDLTSTSSSSTSTCLGLIQAYAPGSAVANIADIILGVPFMRSAYTVMAYDTPDARGVFPNSTNGMSWSTIRPRLGLLGLTNASLALDEFHTVRVLNQPLPPGGGTGTGGGGAGQANGAKLAEEGGKKFSVGLEVLLGLVGFFVLCFLLFGIRWAVHRRRIAALRREQTHARSDIDGDGEWKEPLARDAVVSLVRRSTLSSRYGPPSTTLGGKGARESGYTDDTARTRVAELDDDEKSGCAEEGGEESGGERELGYRRVTRMSSRGEATLVGTHPELARMEDTMHEEAVLMKDHDHDSSPQSPDQPHMRMPSVGTEADAKAVAVPLLTHTRGHSRDSYVHERTPLGMGMGRTGTRARVGSFGSASYISRTSDDEEQAPGRRDTRESMAGVGTFNSRTRARMSSSSSRFGGSVSGRQSSQLVSPLLSPPPPSHQLLLPHDHSASASASVSRGSLSAETTNGHSAYSHGAL